MAEQGAFFGNPKLGRQGDRGRKNLARTYEDTWLDSAIKGFLGEEEAQGSVLEPGREKKAQSNSLGQAAGIFTDLAGPAKAMMLAPLMGAIRLKGAKDLVATHAFDASRASRIAESGYLRAPSIGITSNERNAYSPGSAQFVFPAGFLEPERRLSTLVNRDGYFANPTGIVDYVTGETSPAKLKEQITRYMSQASAWGGKDMRLVQGFPGGSQTAAVGLSPSFKSFKEFEKSEQGAALLRQQRGERNAVHNQNEHDFNLLRAQERAPDSELLALSILKDHNAGLPVRAGREEVVEQAMFSPSAMAELKIMENLPLNPGNAFVHVPTHYGQWQMPEELAKLNTLRDKGFKFVSSKDLSDMAGMGGVKEKEIYKQLPKTVPDTGGWRLPPSSAENSEAWKDFINPGAGGSPPLSTIMPPKLNVTDKALADANPFGLGATPTPQVDFPNPIIQDALKEGIDPITYINAANEQGFLTPKEFQDALMAAVKHLDF